MMQIWFRALPVSMVLVALAAFPAFSASGFGDWTSPGRDASAAGEQAVPPLPPSPPVPPVPPASQAAPPDGRAAALGPVRPFEAPAVSSRSSTLPEPQSSAGATLPRQSGQIPRNAGRYQLVAGCYPDKNGDVPVTILLDTASGRSWYLTAGLYWSPMPLERQATGQRARLIRSGLVYTPE